MGQNKGMLKIALTVLEDCGILRKIAMSKTLFSQTSVVQYRQITAGHAFAMCRS